MINNKSFREKMYKLYTNPKPIVRNNKKSLLKFFNQDSHNNNNIRNLNNNRRRSILKKFPKNISYKENLINYILNANSSKIWPSLTLMPYKNIERKVLARKKFRNVVEKRMKIRKERLKRLRSVINAKIYKPPNNNNNGGPGYRSAFKHFENTKLKRKFNVI